MINSSNVNRHAQETYQLNTLSESEAYDLYDDMLNECNVSLFGVNPAEILKQVDQIAYRSGFNDYTDSLLEDYNLSDWH